MPILWAKFNKCERAERKGKNIIYLFFRSRGMVIETKLIEYKQWVISISSSYKVMCTS